MKRAVLLALTAGLLSLGQAARLPLAQVQKPAVSPALDALVFEETGVRIYALECSRRLARQMLEDGHTDFSFLPSGATCANALRAEDALPLPGFLDSAVITRSPDGRSVDIRLTSRAQVSYLLHLDPGWSGTFDRLP